MNRKDQIKNAAMFFANKNKSNPVPYLDFVEAAEWADRTMIERVRQWLVDNRDDLSRVDTDGFIKLICKAMEE